MKYRERIYDDLIRQHVAKHRQMAFVSGARQVGKTTLCRKLAPIYFNWDNDSHRDLILAGPAVVARQAGLDELKKSPPVIVFDEIHKYSRWKRFLKGFFDTYESRCRVLVTGSSRLDVYQRGGDSLMGRYFSYHLHPFSVGELAGPFDVSTLLRPPRAIATDDWQALLKFGGFPEPFCMHSPAFSSRWRNMRRVQMVREDVRDMTRIQELDQLAALERILSNRSSEQLIYSSLAKQVRMGEVTVQAWISTLCSLFHGFLVRPWHRNLSRALRKEPKWYLRDWSGIQDPGQRAETLVACHLLKAVEFWTETGQGTCELRYIRDKEKREVDFLVVRDDQPWFLVEVKQTERTLSPALGHFQRQTKAPHAFQVVVDMPFVEADCFAQNIPISVPAMTFLSQLP
jgi:predicted AAA+ superfamily ATPase